jgi:hypothetical protein
MAALSAANGAGSRCRTAATNPKRRARPVVEILSIFAFLALLAVLIGALFFRTPRSTTFSPSEMDAFRHAEQVKKDLGEVQKLVGPAKPDYSMTIGGSLPKKPDPPPT